RHMTVGVSLDRGREPLLDFRARVLVCPGGEEGARRRRSVGQHRRRESRPESVEGPRKDVQAPPALTKQGQDVSETRRCAGGGVNQILLGRERQRALEERHSGAKITVEK